jgi:hypothetical protein
MEASEPLCLIALLVGNNHAMVCSRRVVFVFVSRRVEVADRV